MVRTFEAVFDGNVLRTDSPIGLEPNTRVRLTIETLDRESPAAGESFLQVAQSLKLDGPKDWAENIEGYLYGGAEPDAG